MMAALPVFDVNGDDAVISVEVGDSKVKLVLFAYGDESPVWAERENVDALARRILGIDQ